MKIIVDGISVEIYRKNIKNMYIRVKSPNGDVVVSAPMKMNRRFIEETILERIDWIHSMQEEARKTPHLKERQYISGEILYLWGRPYILEVVHGNGKKSIILSGDKMILTMKKDSTIEQREKFVKEWYRSLLKMEIESVLPVWEERTGLYCSGWQTKQMKTRWGTCNTQTKKIWLNLQLAQKSPECLEYVVLHELAHLKERGHGPAFKAILDQYMPEWRAIRKKLNEKEINDHIKKDRQLK